MPVKVLLSRIEGTVNLGFIARAMANTGFSELAFTGSISVNDEALKFAVHAADILHSSERCASFDKLVSRSDVIIGFTPRSPFSDANLPFEKLSGYVDDKLNEGLTVGLLFGNEASGLENSELSVCSRRVALPTCENYVSMNLAQAVLISLWQIKGCKREIEEDTEHAGRESKERLLAKMKEHLELIDFFNAENPHQIWEELRQTVESHNFTSRQTELLLSVFAKSTSRYRHLLKKLTK